MEVEVVGEDGSKFALVNDEKTVFGRGCGFSTCDRTVSRRHVSFQLHHSDAEVADDNARVRFEVTGKNPFWVYDGKELRFFRKFEKGHLQPGDRFCFSPNTPFWYSFTLSNKQPQLNLDEIHISEIDPVKEFGFLVMGHEFDNYPKGVIRNAKNWEWFLEEPRKDSEDEEDSEKERRKMRGKRKMGKGNEDDEWTGESEDDKKTVVNMRKGKPPRYSTRSKDSKGGTKDTKASQNSKAKKTACVDETVEEDDDETLGGFIVAEKDDDGDDKEEDSDEEEEDFEDDDLDD
ncbi:unnamed protein product [Sphenostylis stenocarpa]|uniref:FHA domain-containing protein n=1 Tax=Sphenostylis stenocarpa TaxID=92480 RepID=A0AA86SEB4_9FABA|nr:unnamed protein product [Sphenostylis stenocarpa]